MGDPLFGADVAGAAEWWLQAALRGLGAPNWDRYTLHCLRRGVARELVENGGTAADLCRAGSWSTSGAFARYLDLRSLESQAAAAAQGALDFEGDSENDI